MDFKEGDKVILNHCVGGKSIDQFKGAKGVITKIVPIKISMFRHCLRNGVTLMAHVKGPGRKGSLACALCCLRKDGDDKPELSKDSFEEIITQLKGVKPFEDQPVKVAPRASMLQQIEEALRRLKTNQELLDKLHKPRGPKNDQE